MKIQKKKEVSKEAVLDFIKVVFNKQIPHDMIAGVHYRHHYSSRTIHEPIAFTEKFEEILFYWLEQHPVYNKEFNFRRVEYRYTKDERFTLKIKPIDNLNNLDIDYWSFISGEPCKMYPNTKALCELCTQRDICKVLIQKQF